MRITIKKLIAACLLAVVLSLIAAIGVSASENIALLDWGWGKEDNVSSFPTSCYLYDDPNESFKYLYRSSVVTNMFGFTAKSGYTYTYTHSFYLNGDISNMNIAQGTLLNTLGYKYSLYSDYTGDGFSRQSYAGTITTALVSVTKIDQNQFTLKVVFNTDAAGIQAGDLYLFANVFKKVSQDQVTITVGNEGMVCIKDLDGTVFESAVLDAVNQIKEDNENYHSNALELLDQIINMGADKPVPSNDQLASSVSGVDSAESAIISASDPSGSALSDFSEKGKTVITSVNTSYRQTFAFINSLVTRVMDDLDFGTLVFLALTLGLIAYILGRIK